MDIRPKDLIVKLGIKSQNSLNTYIGRAEFSHIKKVRINKVVYLHGITNRDIKMLKLFMNRRSLTMAEREHLSQKIQRINRKEENEYKNLSEKYKEFI